MGGELTSIWITIAKQITPVSLAILTVVRANGRLIAEGPQTVARIQALTQRSGMLVGTPPYVCPQPTLVRC
jgi:hypothetical protein